MARDITERKHAEDKLRRAHDELELRVQERTAALEKANVELNIEIAQRARAERSLAFRNTVLSTQQETSLDGILVVDDRGRMVSFNQRFVDMWGIPADVLESESDERALQSVLDKLVDPEDFISRVNYLYANRNQKSHEKVLLVDGRTFERYSAPMLGPDGAYYGRVWYFGDITERLRAEQQIESSLREKEVLLQEIHHRVKNNLQVISSLLSLQASTIEDPLTLEILTESQNRVRSMALIHEKLYRSESLSRIDFGDYIDGLTNHLFRTYNARADGIQLKIDVNKVYLGVDTAAPCGLLLNELVSNALKHGFPNRTGGEIYVGLEADRGAVTLVVRDDGVGLPVDVDIRTAESLGLQLVNTLVEQLDGTIELHRVKPSATAGGQGASFQVTFAAPEHGERG
jgi:two-component sensor histidine kinase